MRNRITMPEMAAMVKNVDELRNSIYTPKKPWLTPKDDEWHTCNSCGNFTYECGKGDGGFCLARCWEGRDPDMLRRTEATDGKECERWELA